MPLPSRPVTGRRLMADVLYERLLDAIVAGRLQPDETVSEGSIAAWAGTSRTPAREALDRLAIVGLVAVQPRRPSRITPLDPDVQSATLVALGCLLPEVARSVVRDLADVHSLGGGHATASDLFASHGLFGRMVKEFAKEPMTSEWDALSIHVRRYWNHFPSQVPDGISATDWGQVADGNAAAKLVHDWFQRVEGRR